MANNFIFLTVLLIIILIYYVGFSDSPIFVQEKKPMYFNLNIKDICQALNNSDSDSSTSDSDSSSSSNNDNNNIKNSKNDNKKSETKTKKRKHKKHSRHSRHSKHSKDTELLKIKKQFNELKLEVEDDSTQYRFSNSDRYLIDNKVEDGDDALTTQMLHMGSKNKEAIINRAMYSKNSLIPYLEEELNQYENAYGWWDDGDLENAF